MNYHKRLLTSLFILVNISISNAWEKQSNPLWTVWGEKITPGNVLQEYPRPQMERENWMNLNGLWQCRQGFESDPFPAGQHLSQEILVPFCVESALSGIKQDWRRIWYRKNVTLPEEWSSKKILLHFGAVDWESEVFINGSSAGIHKGGYDPFTYDITPYLSKDNQEIIVRVYDPTDSDSATAFGKQLLQAFKGPGFDGTRYAPVSGIWQTVWLEAVPETYIEDLKLVPDIDNHQLNLNVNVSGPINGITFEAKAYDGIKEVCSISGDPSKLYRMNIPNPKLWSNKNPFLYDLKIKLIKNGTPIDSVKSYFGMRKVSLGEKDGVKVVMLNNEFVFNMGPLDQGYWPDGLYTAPSDEALRWDIEKTLDLGFNATRKHIKVEPDRWYYWCDKLGLIVWQDMPAGYPKTAETKAQFEHELERMVQTHWNHPCITQWVVFNEGWGKYDEVRLTNNVIAMDSTRLVTSNSGVGEGGHFNDLHWYSAPVMPGSDAKRAKVLGEYGALCFKFDDHLWFPNYWTNHARVVKSEEEYSRIYLEYIKSLCQFRDNYKLSGAIYTQLTDVEGEINGHYTYDRKFLKGNLEAIRQAHRATYTEGISVSSYARPGNLALNKPVQASSSVGKDTEVSNVNDGNVGTRWISLSSDPQWICVDLGSVRKISEVKIWWESSYAKEYKIQVSRDGKKWENLYSTSDSDGLIDDISGLKGSGRYVRLYATKRALPYGYSLYEFEVFSDK